jgi:hypothetical protein
MKKVVEKCFIGKAINRTADTSGFPADASDNIAEGEVIVLDKDKNILSAGATIADTSSIFIAEGLGETYSYVNEAGTSVTGVRKWRCSDEIKGNSVVEYSAKSYSAPVQAVWTIDAAGWTPVAGNEYILKIVYKDIDSGIKQFSHTYHYIAGTDTLDTEMAGIVSLINKDSKRRVVAAYTSGTDTFTLTALAIDDDSTVNSIDEYRQVNFEVFNTTENITWTSSALSVGPQPGSGYWKQVRDEEKWSEGYDGITNRTAFPVIKPDMRTVKDETYDVVVIRHKNWYTSAMGREEQVDLTTKLFLPDDAGQTANILAVLNTWMASLPKAFASVAV